MQEFASLLHHGGYALVLIAFAAGVALNYYGLKLHYIALFVGGAVVGFLVGAPASALAGYSQTESVLMAVVAAVLCGFLAIAYTQGVVCLIGFLVSVLLAMACDIRNPWVLVGVALLGGVLALKLYNFAIIIMTSFSGSAMLFYALVNGHALFTTGHVAYLPMGGFKYLQRLERSLAHGNLQSMLDTMRADAWLFLLLMATGVAVQCGLHKALKRRCGQPGADRLGRNGEPKRAADGPDPSCGESPRELRAAPGAEAAPPVASKRPVRMHVHGGGILHCSLDLVPCSMDIGSDSSCPVLLPDSSVSGVHARLRVGGDGTVLLEDMGAADGVLLNGMWPVDRHVVGPGERFDIGCYELRFE